MFLLPVNSASDTRSRENIAVDHQREIDLRPTMHQFTPAGNNVNYNKTQQATTLIT